MSGDDIAWLTTAILGIATVGVSAWAVFVNRKRSSSSTMAELVSVAVDLVHELRIEKAELETELEECREARRLEK